LRERQPGDEQKQQKAERNSHGRTRYQTGARMEDTSWFGSSPGDPL
jgi:hypothetical protein